MKHLKSYNESIIQYHVLESVTDYLKPKSKEDILKSLENLTDKKKFLKACEYGIDWLIDDMLNKKISGSFNIDKYSYYNMENFYSVLNFSDKEKKEIDSVLNDHFSKRTYEYDVTFNGDDDNFDEIYSLVIDKNLDRNIWYFQKYAKYILVKFYYGFHSDYFIVTLDDILNFIYRHNLKAKRNKK